ncbi:MAG: LTA synthase family protein [Ruminococcaceae bacterium]|nr:LTA synthase family protein [Oscillospiraceae bacterium]
MRFKNRQALASAFANFALWFVTIVYMETVLHAIVFEKFTANFIFAVGFSAVIACVLSLLTSFLPEKAHFPVDIILMAGLILLYGSQLVYNFIFGTLYSTTMVQQGGDAITSFWRETLLTMWENILFLLLLLVPLIAFILIKIFCKKLRGKIFAPSNAVYRIITAIAAVVIHISLILCLSLVGTGPFTNYYFYYESGITIDQSAERFGLITAIRLELFDSDEVTEEEYYYEPVIEEDSTPTSSSAESIGEERIEYNVLDIDFEALNEMTDNEKIQAINTYCANLTGTNKNEYTGMLHDYNLIVLCAESFASGAIDPVLTPTLYRLANEGIIFNNFYNTFPNTTTDGEYSLCMGLYPDTTRSKAVSSLYASRDSYLPFVLGNIFNEQADIQSYGYHNYLGSYYGRDESHPNMGYEMKFAKAGMDFTSSWPASDLEMMEQSVDDYIGQEQFHAYYMTFSGHYKYDTAINPIAKRNWNLVKDLDLSDASKCYLSCNIELDKALEYLMQRLEEEGIADKTAIVLAGDHFPYGLSDSQYSELMGYDIDEFSKYKSTLIFWVGGLEENIVVDEYCCNVDILPTILNLWGFSYDSRLLAGTDVFSDGTHMAVLIDKSFLTDKVWFNANTGEATYLIDESELPEGYLDNMIKLISTKFSVSSNILNTAYYNFLFEKGKVTITRDSWHDEVEEPEEEEEIIVEGDLDGDGIPDTETDTTPDGGDTGDGSTDGGDTGGGTTDGDTESGDTDGGTDTPEPDGGDTGTDEPDTGGDTEGGTVDPEPPAPTE